MENKNTWWYPLHEHIVQFIASQPFIGALLTLILLDIITGFITAFILKKISSIASYNGMLKKSQMILFVCCGSVIESIYADIPWGKIIAMFFCLTETISIAENLSKSGIPLPKQITDTLAKLKEDSKENKPKDY